MNEPPQQWIAAARLLRPQGRRGELLAEREIAAEIFSPGRHLWLANSAGTAPSTAGERILEAAWEPTGRNAGRIVLKLAGIDTISEAEAFAGQLLLMPAADLPPLDADTFRVRDLVGCALFDGDTLVGTVVDVQFPVGADGRTRLTDAPDLLAVDLGGPAASSYAAASDSDDPTLIPFAQAWVVEVNTDAKRIVMHLPPGLLPSAEGETTEGETPDQR